VSFPLESGEVSGWHTLMRLVEERPHAQSKSFPHLRGEGDEW
jgi:hypothetical protein